MMTDDLPLRLRELRCEMGLIARADGSCSFSSGGSVAWASVNGPGDAPSSKRKGDRLIVECTYRPACGDADQNTLDSLLRAALEHTVNLKLFPRAAVQVTVHELQSDGSSLSLALTSAGMALLDSAVPVFAPFCGVEVVLVNGRLLVDPDAKTERSAQATFLFAFSTHIPKGDKSVTPQPIVVGSRSRGSFSLSQYLTAKDLGAKAAEQIFAFFKESLQRKFTVESIA